MEIVQLWLADFFQPCVYAWKRGDRWLYVGISRKGLARLGNHQVVRPGKCEADDELLVFRCPPSDVRALERKLIATHCPEYNIVGVSGLVEPSTAVSRGLLSLNLPKSYYDQAIDRAFSPHATDPDRAESPAKRNRARNRKRVKSETAKIANKYLPQLGCAKAG